MEKKFSVNFNVEVISSSKGGRNYILRAVIDPRQMPITIGVYSSSKEFIDVIDEFNDSIINSSHYEQDG